MIVYYSSTYKVEKVYADLQRQRTSSSTAVNFLSCPAVRKGLHNVFMLSPKQTSTVTFDDATASRTDNLSIIKERKGQLEKTNTFSLNEFHYFFSESPLEIKVTAPYSHKASFQKNGTFIGGVFDIGRWFRPIACEIITWEEAGEITFVADEPLFYVQFLTDEPIVLQKFILTPILDQLSTNLVASPFATTMKNLEGTLDSRYEAYEQSSYKEGILEEIKANLVSRDEASPTV